MIDYKLVTVMAILGMVYMVVGIPVFLAVSAPIVVSWHFMLVMCIGALWWLVVIILYALCLIQELER